MNSPLRVALFTGNFNYTRDGATQALGRLVSHLREVEKAEVRIYSPTLPNAPLARGLVSIPSIALPGRAEYRLGLGLNGAARRDVAAFNPDIFHLSTPDLVGFQAQGLARRMDRPLVSSLHTRFETYLAYYGLGLLEPVMEQQLRRFYGRCDYILAPTPIMVQDMNKGGLHGKVRLWSRGVDRALFDPARRDLEWRRAQGFAGSDFVVLFFGRLVLEKGLALFADAFDRLRAGRPDVRAGGRRRRRTAPGPSPAPGGRRTAPRSRCRRSPGRAAISSGGAPRASPAATSWCCSSAAWCWRRAWRCSPTPSTACARDGRTCAP